MKAEKQKRKWGKTIGKNVRVEVIGGMGGEYNDLISKLQSIKKNVDEQN